MIEDQGDFEVKMKMLQRLRGLALAGRGVSFLERGQLKEALRDLKLSLQSITGIWSLLPLHIDDNLTR